MSLVNNIIQMYHSHWTLHHRSDVMSDQSGRLTLIRHFSELPSKVFQLRYSWGTLSSLRLIFKLEERVPRFGGFGD
jgi:hypothetical protein